MCLLWQLELHSTRSDDLPDAVVQAGQKNSLKLKQRKESDAQLFALLNELHFIIINIIIIIK